MTGVTVNLTDFKSKPDAPGGSVRNLYLTVISKAVDHPTRAAGTLSFPRVAIPIVSN